MVLFPVSFIYKKNKIKIYQNIPSGKFSIFSSTFSVSWIAHKKEYFLKESEKIFPPVIPIMRYEMISLNVYQKAEVIPRI